MAVSPSPTLADSSGSTDSNCQCCVVGGGPAGVVLSFLLARRGVAVTLLEAHQDFDRDFRGDTLHPSTMELMDQLGLADALLELPHTKLRTVSMQTPSETITFADFNGLKSRFPFIVLMPQSEFLKFLADEAAKYPNFTLIMGANVQELIHEDGLCVGVKYRTSEGSEECRAPVTVACDGRFSKLRKLAGLTPVKTAPPMDVLWFRMPRNPDDGVDLTFRINNGHMLVMLERGDHWQLGYLIIKGSFHDVREQGLEKFRESMAALAPELVDRLQTITDWKQITPLNVEASRLTQWSKPGLLLIGDAAHVMSPVGGVGINYAVQDAIETANVLSEPLLKSNVTTADLDLVRKHREFATKVIQRFQEVIQKRIVLAGLDDSQTFRPPWFLKLPIIRNMPVRLIAFGVNRSRLKE